MRCGHQQVLEHRHTDERMRNLVGAADAFAAALMREQARHILALEQHAATVRPQVPLIRLNNVVLPAPFGPSTPKA